jgi:D-amino-acid dehydrogenase
MTSWDLIVVGGGIVGASAAYHGARAGGRVLLIDRDDPGRATAAGAGIVAPETDVHHSAAYYELASRAAAYYPNLLDGLERRAGWQRCGMLVVAADDAEARAFDAFAAAALERQRARGDVAPAEALRAIDAGEARDRFPALATVARALWNPRGARVDGREMNAALLDGALARGATRIAGSVESISPDGGDGAGVVLGAAGAGEEHRARAVIVAGGAWSPRLAAAVGVRVPVEPQRGQIAHLVLDGVDTSLWPMVSGFRDHYLVAWPGGRVAAGATRETGSGFDVRITAAGVREVLAEALRLAPGLAPATLADVRVGLRPLSSDGQPVLGPIPDRRGLWLATGHGPAGLTLGPYSGKLVAEAALGGRSPAELDAFALTRFATASR